MTDYTIHTLDLNFQGLSHTIASYLIEGPEGLLLIETGPGSTLSTLKTELAAHGCQPEDIQHVLVTHIHFDHAGASGWWAQNGATVYAHHFGTRHLIDPSRLIASASRIYGDQMGPLWGDILPAPAENVVALYDGDMVEAAGLRLYAIETPGHARHHHVFVLGNIAFTGDTAGMKLGNLPLLDIPAPPPEFDLEAWQNSLTKLIGCNFDTIYPTHFGPVTNVREHLTAVKTLVADCANFVREQMETGVERDTLIDRYTEWNHGRAWQVNFSDLEILKYDTTNPLYMSVDGIMRYWQKRWERADAA
ncbi:MAG: MBL fold metallo-hydrolase [Chloroflexi bacterium]|nr:MBL fold metallo-hydrolase [Chloroflexota bacterium]